MMTLSLAGLDELLEELRNAPEVYRPSPFWEELAAIGLRQLEGSGLENFKRSVNMSYFSWDVLGIVLRNQLTPVLAQWLRRRSWGVFKAEFSGYRSELSGSRNLFSVSNHWVRLRELTSFSPAAALLYRTYVAMLWEYVSEHDSLELLRRLDEPTFGNPFLIRYSGRAISQDLCNSVLEFYSAGAADAADGRRWQVAELGAGYGRLAFVMLHALPAASVCLIDIAPALNIAQAYLGHVFPDERIFYFRPFRRYDDVREEFDSARIRFLAPSQIELLPPGQFDLFVNISSLHEMTYAQVDNYIRQIGRLCRGRFYTKQWRVSQAKVNGVVLREHDYPIPAGWRQIYHRQHAIQRKFFEALYEVGAA
jgi:putative sugar O-methyltransferase